jgi:hypothetical protein
MASTRPGCPERRRASASANQAVGAACPASTVPETRKARGPSAVVSVTRSPTRAPGVARATSPERGARPSVSFSPVKAVEPQPCAVTVRSPDRTGKVTSATAVRAPGTAAAFVTRASSSRARSGSGMLSSVRSSPLPVTKCASWSAAATTGAFA